MMKEDNIIEGSETPVEENVETDMISDVSAEIDVAPVGDASSDTPVEPVADPSPEETPAEDAAEAQSRVAESSPAETPAAPGYGAPQMLYEDFIPYEYLHDTPPPTVADTPAENIAREEEEKKKKKKGKEKEKKPSREEAELLAAVEAEIAAQSASQPEPPLPQETPVAEPKPPAAQDAATTEPVAPVVAVDPIPVVTSVTAEPEEADYMDDEVRMNEPVEREYSSQEKKWRRKYKMDKDILLSANGVVPGFVLAKRENVVRCYACLDSAKGDGTICLTNKRILINTDEKSEVAVENITGVKFSKNTYFSFFKFLFALIFFGVGAFLIAYPFLKESMQVAFIENIWKDWFKYLFVAVGAVLVLISLPLWAKMVKRYFYFNIFVKESTPFFECKSKAVVKCEKKGGQFTFLLSDAGREIEKAARELGALIIEVKDGRYNF